MNQILAIVAEAALCLFSEAYTITRPSNLQNTAVHKKSETRLATSLEIHAPHHVGWKYGCNEVHDNIPR